MIVNVGKRLVICIMLFLLLVCLFFLVDGVLGWGEGGFGFIFFDWLDFLIMIFINLYRKIILSFVDIGV